MAKTNRNNIRPGSPAQTAIPALIDLHGPKLYGLASRLCGNAADAEDMVQEVFLQAYRKWSTFRGESNPGTWLYAIAARACKARSRRKGGIDRRMPALSQLLPWSETTVAGLNAPGRETGPASAAMQRESALALRAAILTLPESFRVALVLKEMLEMSIEDVGGALGVKPETVKTRVHRARLMLRKAMTERLPSRSAPAPSYERRVCLDLLKAKMDALDKGRGFPIGQSVVCDRCRAVFAELDLVQDTCLLLSNGKMPARVRASIMRAIAREA